MSIDWRFDFRNTEVYVTDPSNCSFVGTFNAASSADTTVYPYLYSNGATGGFEQTCSDPTRNRSTSVDVRVAGNNRSNTGDPVGGRYFRVDLPSAGSYDTRVAQGDALFGFAQNAVSPSGAIYDTTTLLFTVVSQDTTIGINEYWDATGILRTSDTDWATNNAAKTLTFSTTIYRYLLAEPTALSANNVIAHLRVTTSAGGAATIDEPPDSRFPRRIMNKRQRLRPTPTVQMNPSAVVKIKRLFLTMGVGK